MPFQSISTKELISVASLLALLPKVCFWMVSKNWFEVSESQGNVTEFITFFLSQRQATLNCTSNPFFEAQFKIAVV